MQSGNSNGSSTFPGKRGQQKNALGKRWRAGSTFMGLTLENPLGTSAGATWIFLLIGALLRRFLETDVLFSYVSVKCQLLWALGAWLRSPSATLEILILIKNWWNWCSFEHALCTLLAAPGCNVRVHLVVKTSVYAPSQLPRLTGPNPATEIKKVTQARKLGLLGLYSPEVWDSPRAQHTLPVNEYSKF